MWGLLPLAVRMKIVTDTKKMIKRHMCANGFTEDKESREALEDPDAKEYLDLEISGDESDSDAMVLGDNEDVGGENLHGEDTEVPGSSEGQGDGGEAGEGGEVGPEEVAREGVGNRDLIWDTSCSPRQSAGENCFHQLRYLFCESVMRFIFVGGNVYRAHKDGRLQEAQ